MSDTYFDDAREMFLTDGWKTFQQELDEAIKTVYPRRRPDH